MIELVLLVIISLISIYFVMAKLEGIQADLQAAAAVVVKIKADVTALHAKIDSLGDSPTQEEIDAVKAESAALVESLQGVDDQTEDEITVDTNSGGSGDGF